MLGLAALGPDPGVRPEECLPRGLVDFVNGETAFDQTRSDHTPYVCLLHSSGRPASSDHRSLDERVSGSVPDQPLDVIQEVVDGFHRPVDRLGGLLRLSPNVQRVRLRVLDVEDSFFGDEGDLLRAGVDPDDQGHGASCFLPGGKTRVAVIRSDHSM
jgi:hypothetical protein